MARTKRTGEGRKSSKHLKGDIEEFEPVHEGEGDEFEPVEGEGKKVGEEEFEPVPEEPPVEIRLSRMKVKDGEEAGYEPTIEEILAYATGKTKRPTEAPPPKRDKSEDLARVLTKAKARKREEEAKGKKGKGSKAKKAGAAKAAEEDEDPLAELFEGPAGKGK